ncbi:Bax inhibitor-1/YccA family protein [Candidatus Gracilibacteria bacterium]|nr:Bax inhibitor-1/YccA family protein [Candidatus Gracilibacteria bacterium]
MANPAFNEKSFSGLKNDGESMTISGSINKSIILVSLTVLSAVLAWGYVDIFLPFLIPLVIGAFVFSLVIIFKKETAPYLAPVYALLEGVVIATFSAFFETQYPGIVIQAVTATFAVFLTMLLLYKYRVIQVTQKFRSGVIAATGAIAVLYIISILGSLTGWFEVPFLHSNGPLGIGISIFIVGIAAFNLLLDFDMIEQGSKAHAPKYMEWFAGFGLLITLVWLYLEVLRLLSKIRSK